MRALGVAMGFLMMSALCSAASTSGEKPKSVIEKSFAGQPASFHSEAKGSSVTTELCFDRCYEFKGKSTEQAAYWEFVMLFMASIGSWNVPEEQKAKLAEAAQTATRKLKECHEKLSCVAIRLATQSSTRVSEINYDEGNRCATPLDVRKSFQQGTAITGRTRCTKLTK